MRKRPSIDERLRRAEALPPDDGKAFWTDFKAQAEYLPRDAATGARPTRSTHVRRWSLAGAAAVLAVGIGVSLLRAPGGAPIETVLALQVSAPHSSVFIMQDAEQAGTFIWIDEI